MSEHQDAPEAEEGNVPRAATTVLPPPVAAEEEPLEDFVGDRLV